ncbi:MAG TPA: GNAT family N-acetyltransferase [Chthoniobacterales bacterium]|nr:GNAT family N-acetyltransferase [Chthoniobacterales bacterium]
MTTPIENPHRGERRSPISQQCRFPLLETVLLWHVTPGMLGLTRIEPATIEDLPSLTELLMDLFAQESDFRPDYNNQMRGLRLLLEQPNRGRIFVLRSASKIIGMINLLFTISTAEGGFVILLEDLIVDRNFRDQGLGSELLKYAIDYAKQKNFLRITLLTDRISEPSLTFFEKHGFQRSSMVPMRLWLRPVAAVDLKTGSA